jgi:hypothetical protein
LRSSAFTLSLGKRFLAALSRLSRSGATLDGLLQHAVRVLALLELALDVPISVLST